MTTVLARFCNEAQTGNTPSVCDVKNSGSFKPFHPSACRRNGLTDKSSLLRHEHSSGNECYTTQSELNCIEPVPVSSVGFN